MSYICSRCGESSKDWKVVRDGPPRSAGNVWCGNCVAAVRKGAPVDPQREQAYWKTKGTLGCALMGFGSLVALAGLGLLGVYLNSAVKGFTLPPVNVLYFGIGLLVVGTLLALVCFPSVRRHLEPDHPLPWEVNPHAVDVTVADVLETCARCDGPLFDDAAGQVWCPQCRQSMSLPDMVSMAALTTDSRLERAALDALDSLHDIGAVITTIDESISAIKAEPPPKRNDYCYYTGEDCDVHDRQDAAHVAACDEYHESQRRRCASFETLKNRLQG